MVKDGIVPVGKVNTEKRVEAKEEEEVYEKVKYDLRMTLEMLCCF